MLTKIHIGKLLVDKKIITQDQLDKAVEKQRLTGERLGKILVDFGFVKEDMLLNLLAEQLKIPFIDLKNYDLDPRLVNKLPEFYARRFRAIVISKDEKGLLIGMVDPLDIVSVDELSQIVKEPFHLGIVREEDILPIIDMMYRNTSEIKSLAEELSAELRPNDYDISQLDAGLSSADAPVVKLLKTIFDDAVKVNASDIHIEPDENVLRIRQRIDGVLHEQIVKEKNVAAALTLRLKLMAGLNIAEKRLPQDGRFSIRINNKNFDVRLSTMPVQYGESVVMRLLNQSAELLRLENMGMPANILPDFRKILSLPHGLVLITGPTGSGKTTTLYGALSELNNTQNKIITVEDPVEYRLPRISQVQVLSKIDLDFARVLRSALRQDPDIIMVGELRDKETVLIALRAAMTGHLVLATLHTNDAISSAIRLIDMGAEGYLVGTVLRATIAQRLVRRICSRCEKSYDPTPQEKVWLKAVSQNEFLKAKFKIGAGCTYCHNTGYKGQIGVFEFLEMTPALSDALRENNVKLFTQLARESKRFRPLVLNGLDLASQGITTISEVIRIAGESMDSFMDNEMHANV